MNNTLIIIITISSVSNLLSASFYFKENKIHLRRNEKVISSDTIFLLNYTSDNL